MAMHSVVQRLVGRVGNFHSEDGGVNEEAVAVGAWRHRIADSGRADDLEDLLQFLRPRLALIGWVHRLCVAGVPQSPIGFAAQ